MDAREPAHRPTRGLALRALTASLWLAAPTVAPSAAQAACACTAMTVEHANGANVTMCSAYDQNFPECTKQGRGVNPVCPTTSYTYVCPVGVNNRQGLEQRTGFGVRTVLTGDSNDCRSGQALQLTITSNQAVYKPSVHTTPTDDVQIGNFSARLVSNPPTVMPDVGAMTPPPNALQSFGADSYTDPNSQNLLIERTATAIKWWDNTDQSKDNAQEQATWAYRFASFIRGSDGQQSCACVFNVNVDWSGANPTTTMSRVDAQSTLCAF